MCWPDRQIHELLIGPGYVEAPGALQLRLINYLSENTSKENIQDPTHSPMAKWGMSWDPTQPYGYFYVTS